MTPSFFISFLIPAEYLPVRSNVIRAREMLKNRRLGTFFVFVFYLLQLTCPWAFADQKNGGYVGNQACAQCHLSIFKAYSEAPMSHASGSAKDNFKAADFYHENSDTRYRIDEEGGRVLLHFERAHDPSVRGQREMLYFIGSGHRGLKYLFVQDGFLFESPIDWYAGKQRWDMTPNYQNAREIPLNLPAFTSCLRCHVSEMETPAPGTQNRYATPVFRAAGVSCERCHGPGEKHVKGGPIINPAKLAADRRDSICMQCHLEGKAGIERRGRHAYEFQAGDRLTDYIRHYVADSDSKTKLSAVSEVEALADSVCKKKSGDSMSCTSCHDPHSSPPPGNRVNYYRQKCLSCHGNSFGDKHHVENPDCTQCHMPANPSADIAHTQVADHRILRRPSDPSELTRTQESNPAFHLAPFPDSEEARKDVRDLGLAWESLAERGINGADKEAGHLLGVAVAESPDDAVALAALGYMEQRHGAIERARSLYQKALGVDPSLIDAATNLGVIEAQAGHLATALVLWKDVFARAPNMSGVGMNLVRGLCSTERFDDARGMVLRVLEFNPDMADAKNALRYLNRTPPTCGR